MTTMHYTYIHINEHGVFYVGCGLLKRTWPRTRGTSKWKHFSAGGYSILTVGEFENHQDALNHEKLLIAYFGPKANQTSGGEGVSIQSREKMALTRQGSLNPRYGKKAGPETLKKLSEVHKGKSLSLEQKKLYSLRFSGEGNPMFGKRGELAPCYGRTGEKHPMYGKHQSEEAKAKISNSLKTQPRYQCSCGLVTLKGAMSMHQKSKGHNGLTLLGKVL